MPLHPSAWFKLQNKVGKKSQTNNFVLIKKGEVFHRGQVVASSAAREEELTLYCTRVSYERNRIRSVFQCLS